MNCEWMTKVSLLVDGELSTSESDQIRNHIALCQTCRETYDEFLKLREEIQDYPYQRDPLAQKRALNNILRIGNETVWRNRLALPTPVFALLILAAFLMGILTVSLLPGWFNDKEGTISISPTPNDKSITPLPITTDFSRFDRGERTLIYVVKKRAPVNSGGQR
ncbi:MAG: zf-HC2 domain-containing protein [Acidobacteriota bacterium]